MPTRISIRPLKEIDQFKRCEEIQREAWGFNDLDIVPAPMFTIAALHGGIVLGAFDGATIVGFVYSLPAHVGGEWLQYSHMLAVVPALRRRRIGLRLKLAQSRVARRQGFRTIAWTFDPLQARNALLNLNRLGAICREYYVNLYGDTSSPLHRGLATDRLLALWRLDRPARSARGGNAPLVYDCSTAELRGLRAFRFGIPLDLDSLKQTDPGAARDVQLRLRRVFTRAFRSGFVAIDFSIDTVQNQGFYRLERGGKR